MNEKDFEEYFQKKLKEDQEKIGNLPIELLRDTYRLEYELKINMPSLILKMEPQELDYRTVEVYLPEKWEMPRNGKLLYSDEELLNVLKLIIYNLGVRESLDSIPRSLIEQYVKENKEDH
jgi:hypothetical protein